MILLAADENFDHHIVRALLRRVPEVDVRTVQEQGMAGAADPDVLKWAASENRVLLTHDVRTITKYAFERVERGESMPGVIEIQARAPVGTVLEDLVVFVTCATVDDCCNQVVYLPLRRH